MMRIELLKAWPQRFESVTVELGHGASVSDALASAGWALDTEFVGVALFGIASELQATLHDGDRVELLRALQVDPKQARRLRAGRRR